MQWAIIVFLSFTLFAEGRTKGEREKDFALEPSSESFKETYENTMNRQLRSTLYDKGLYDIFNHFKEKGDFSSSKLPRKRALSALSRWKPLGNLGIRIKAIHRPSARAPMMSIMPESNLMSVESEEGVRPLGQPLRWGRKR